MARPIPGKPYAASAEAPQRKRDGTSAPHPAARAAIRSGIADATDTGLPASQLLAILMSETLPRLVNAYGKANAALILDRLAHEIRTGSAPHFTRQ